MARCLYGQGTIGTLVPLWHCPGDRGWRAGGVDQRAAGAEVTGQVTCSGIMATAAAKSEPSGHPDTPVLTGDASVDQVAGWCGVAVYPGW